MRPQLHNGDAGFPTRPFLPSDDRDVLDDDPLDEEFRAFDKFCRTSPDPAELYLNDTFPAGSEPVESSPRGWYMAQGDHSEGPFYSDEITRLWESGQLTPDSLVWRPGFARWEPLTTIEELTDRVAPAPDDPFLCSLLAEAVDDATLVDESMIVEDLPASPSVPASIPFKS